MANPVQIDTKVHRVEGTERIVIKASRGAVVIFLYGQDTIPVSIDSIIQAQSIKQPGRW